MKLPSWLSRLAVATAVLAVVVLGVALAVHAHVNRLVSQDWRFEILGPGSQIDLGPSARLEVPEGFVALVQESSAPSGTVETIELCREPDYASPLLTVDRFEDGAALRRAVGFFAERESLVETSAREPLPSSEGWRWYAKEGRTGSRLRALAVNERVRLVVSVLEGNGEADAAEAIRRFVR
ncbi:hypothetical protein emb_1c0158 [Coriobacteriaceae bacterium EMTCatB1]|nr:hypothetical protein emb_1c0158 [Coriobacteriaceae bacterium EMTCatB1]